MKKKKGLDNDEKTTRFDKTYRRRTKTASSKENLKVSQSHSKLLLHALYSAVSTHKWDDAFRLLPCIFFGRGTLLLPDFIFRMMDIITRNVAGIPDGLRRSLCRDFRSFGVKASLINLDILSQDLQEENEEGVNEMLQNLEEYASQSCNSNIYQLTALCEAYRGAILYCQWKNEGLYGGSNSAECQISIEDCADGKEERDSKSKIMAQKAHAAIKGALCNLCDPVDWILSLYLELESELHGPEAALTVLLEYVENNPQHLPAQLTSYKFLKQFVPGSHITQMAALKEICRLCPQVPLVLEYVDRLIAEATLEKAGMIETAEVDSSVDNHSSADSPTSEGYEGNCDLKSDAYIESLWRCVNLLTNLLEYKEWRWKIGPWERLTNILQKFYLSWLRCWKCPFCRSSRKLLELVCKRIMPLWQYSIWKPLKMPLLQERLRIIFHQTFAAHVLCYDIHYVKCVISLLKKENYKELSKELMEAFNPSLPFLRRFKEYRRRKCIVFTDDSLRSNGEEKKKVYSKKASEESLTSNLVGPLDEDANNISFDIESMFTSTQMKKHDENFQSCSGIGESPVLLNTKKISPSYRGKEKLLKNKDKTGITKHYDELFLINGDEEFEENGINESKGSVNFRDATGNLSSEDYITADQASQENSLVQESPVTNINSNFKKKLKSTHSKPAKIEILKHNSSYTQSEVSCLESELLNCHHKSNCSGLGTCATCSGYKGGTSEEYNDTSQINAEGNSSIYFQHTGLPKPGNNNCSSTSGKRIFVEESQTQSHLNYRKVNDTNTYIIHESQSQRSMLQSEMPEDRDINDYESNFGINENEQPQINNFQGIPLSSQYDLSQPFSLTMGQQTHLQHSQNGQELVWSQAYPHILEEGSDQFPKSAPSNQSLWEVVSDVLEARRSSGHDSPTVNKQFSGTDTDRFVTPRSNAQTSLLDTTGRDCNYKSDEESFVGPSQELVENSSLCFQRKKMAKLNTSSKTNSDNSIIKNSCSESESSSIYGALSCLKPIQTPRKLQKESKKKKKKVSYSKTESFNRQKSSEIPVLPLDDNESSQLKHIPFSENTDDLFNDQMDDLPFPDQIDDLPFPDIECHHERKLKKRRQKIHSKRQGDISGSSKNNTSTKSIDDSDVHVVNKKKKRKIHDHEDHIQDEKSCPLILGDEHTQRKSKKKKLEMRSKTQKDNESENVNEANNLKGKTRLSDSCGTTLPLKLELCDDKDFEHEQFKQRKKHKNKTVQMNEVEGSTSFVNYVSDVNMLQGKEIEVGNSVKNFSKKKVNIGNDKHSSQMHKKKVRKLYTPDENDLL